MSGRRSGFREPPNSQRLAGMSSDFAAIKGFLPWVYEQNREHVRWLDEVVREGDIVVTHHLPSARSVAAKYEGDPLNAFFVSADGPPHRGAAASAVGSRPHARVLEVLASEPPRSSAIPSATRARRIPHSMTDAGRRRFARSELAPAGRDPIPDGSISHARGQSSRRLLPLPAAPATGARPGAASGANPPGRSCARREGEEGGQNLP